MYCLRVYNTILSLKAVLLNTKTLANQLYATILNFKLTDLMLLTLKNILSHAENSVDFISCSL